jgi:hypothetical protein
MDQRPRLWSAPRGNILRGVRSARRIHEHSRHRRRRARHRGPAPHLPVRSLSAGSPATGDAAGRPGRCPTRQSASSV